MATKDSQAPQVTIGGTTYRLRYDYGAMMELCDALGATISNMQEVMGQLPVSQMHLPLWCGMLDQAPTLKPEDVRAMLKPMDIPDGQAVVTTAMAAFQQAMVRAQKGATADAAASPPTPAADPA